MLNSVQWACINHLIAHEMSPPEERLDHEAFCESIGISKRSMERYRTYKWTCEKGHEQTSKDDPKKCSKCKSETLRKAPLYPEFMEALESARKDAAETHDFYALRTRQWALEELRRLYGKEKSTPEKRKILKQIRSETEDVAAISRVVDYSKLPDEELTRMLLNDVTDSERAFAMTIAGEVKGD